jgi:dihydrofolate reductase
VPDTDVRTVINDLTRSVGTLLLGRRMYDVLVASERIDVADQPTVIKDFAQIWQAADKVVCSTTPASASSVRTRIERTFRVDDVRQMKVTAAAERDISVGGPNLAARAIKVGLVGDYHLFVNPALAGGGTSYFPDNTRLGLALIDERRFNNGVVFLRYAARA